MKLFRWRALVPLAVVVGVLVVGTIVFLDPLVKWGIERSGSALVGAKVELASAKVGVLSGTVSLRGLQVTNPNAPMTNLVEASAIVFQVELLPLLEKKVAIDTVAVRDVQFGTPRRTSGAIPHPSPTASAVSREIAAWTDRMHIPPLSLQGLTGAVNVGAVRPESLATLRQAKAVRARADSTASALAAQLRALNPKPQIDSATALAKRLKATDPKKLGIKGTADAVASVRSTIRQLGALDDRVEGLEANVQHAVGGLGSAVRGLDSARRADYAYARGLLKLPALEAPQLGPALFAGPMLDRLTPVLYWMRLADRYMPPGLKARVHPGPKRVRASGETVAFPRAHALPGFVLKHADASVTLGGAGVAAGRYAAVVDGVTSAPALYGKPTTFRVDRTTSAKGPDTLRVAGMLDHTRQPLHDTASALVAGAALPSLTLAPLGTRLALGRGTTALALGRVGDSVNLRWSWSAPAVTWARLTADTGSATLRATQSALFGALSSIKAVQVEARLAGDITHPRLAVGSNVAGALADGLRRQLGDQVRQAQAKIDARVDSLVKQPVAEARAAVQKVERDAMSRLNEQRHAIAAAKAELEARLKALPKIPGIGF